jgi:hypothetical protein
MIQQGKWLNEEVANLTLKHLRYADRRPSFWLDPYAAGIDVVDRLARALGVEAVDLLRRPPASPTRRRRT